MIVGSFGAVLLIFYLLTRLLYIPVNHVAFIESWTGHLRQEGRAGLHLLRLTEWVVAFPLSWFGGKDKGGQVPYHVIPTTPIRIDPAPWDIVSSDKERMKIDLWMTLRITNPRRFLIETSAHDPAAVLMDQVRMQVVEQCKAHT